MEAGDDYRVVGPHDTVEGAVDLGLRPSPERVRALAEAGRTVLVRCSPGTGGADDAAESAEAVALAALYAWLGARVFATAHERPVRQALDMVASVRGRRPPAAARRGLA
ncbi:hypothetical protein ACFPZ0_11125 [Streptomonospora nanhaiensis]|uniref:Uncharacterized protein n=1 Tax=Streptomonospora nanhaiensis TaxID=1323731 RepID=A0A853BTN9_9ACTN|nr:hypothetical protein [Streptomonospora nanhaiensis]MBV2362770.1 hypothetical protein [Streptomonospora nanhaiensis]MBX9388751.1 hypothetical protein [Streptomonospora nanhaiensis]NYI97877.1 hypothetical protein [Streptomonospora nanhaiensis]